MAKVKDVLEFLEWMAPASMKLSFDNVGLLSGWPEKKVNRILTALDITSEVITEAADLNAELIVSHHPLFFSIKSLTADDVTGQKLITLIQKGISAICMHTNLDAAEGGVNDELARIAGITAPEMFKADGVLENGASYGIGRIGDLSCETTLEQYLPRLKSSLGSAGLRFYDAKRPVLRVAVLGGSGGNELMDAVKAGCDTYVTSDIKYDVFLLAAEIGVNLIDADHFCTENIIIPVLRDRIADAFSDAEVFVSKRHGQTAKFI